MTGCSRLVSVIFRLAVVLSVLRFTASDSDYPLRYIQDIFSNHLVVLEGNVGVLHHELLSTRFGQSGINIHNLYAEDSEYNALNTIPASVTPLAGDMIDISHGG